MTPRCFLFDIGNVLVDWNPDYLLQKLLPDADAVAAFRAEAMTEARILEMDRGQDWAAQLAEIAVAVPHHLDTAKAYRDRWVETIREPIAGSVTLFEALRAAGYPIYALSNFGAENFAMAEAVYPFLTHFTGRIISGHEGVVKPDPAIYRLAIDRFGLNPAETLFIDDRRENIDAARALGFQGHLFTTPDTLRDALSQMDLSAPL